MLDSYLETKLTKYRKNSFIQVQITMNITANEKLLEVQDISKRYGMIKALDKVSLSIKKGEVYCLVGENGSGKSTLIKVISGVVIPDEGRIVIDGVSHRRMTPYESIRKGIQVIYQDLSLFPNLSVAENISLNQRLEKASKFVRWKEEKKITERELNSIGVELDTNAMVEDLSIGDRQIVAICRALTLGARLIVMDEPTTALTYTEVESLFSIILGLKLKGISILFVSHKLSEVFRISEKVTVLRDGKRVGTYNNSELDNESLVFYMTGRKIRESNFKCEIKEEKKEAPLLELRNLSKKREFFGINLKLYPGEILGVIGSLGSGRTELATSIFGLNPQDTGKIFINGKEVKINSPRDAMKLGISYLPEDRLEQGLFMEKEISKNLVVAVLKRCVGRLGFLEDKKVNNLAKELSRELNITTPSLYLPVKILSGGNQQRVVIGKWIASNPKIFILDKPTRGIDIASKSDIHNIIRSLANKGIGIILISDEASEVYYNCNRIIIMGKGRIEGELDTRCTPEEELNKIIEMKR